MKADMKRPVRVMLRRAGLDVTKWRNTPFGVRWEDDVAALAKVALAVDVGANEGQTAELMARAFPSARIFSYEPVPDTFSVLQRRCGASPRITCTQAALGANSGTAAMIDGPTSGQNTLLVEAKPGKPTTVVPVTTLSLEAAEHGWDHIDLLKIDTEGFELEVLKGAQPLLKAAAVQFVLAECDFVRRPAEPHGNFFDVVAFLEPFGYRVVAFYTGAVDGRGWVWGDVLFMKEDHGRGIAFTPSDTRSGAHIASSTRRRFQR